VGVRASYPLSDTLTVAGFFVNGWNDGVDNNGGKTFGFQATVKPTSKLTLVQNVMTGPEQLDDTDSQRFLADTIATLNVTPSLSLMANYDFGKDTVAGQAVRWQGIAGYVRYQINETWAVAPRFEYLKDTDGFMTGTSQSLKELTFTAEHKIGGALLTRLEYRRDFSDTPFFLRTGGAAKKSQDTFTVGLVYAFAAKI
jgi:Putative beta-barrel porin-2, OmpL-like. bbp2